MTSKHPELSSKPGSISYVLVNNKTAITELANNSTTLNEMKSFVYDLIIKMNDKPLEKKSSATKTFLKSLTRQKSKLDILSLVYNTILSGDNCKVI